MQANQLCAVKERPSGRPGASSSLCVAFRKLLLELHAQPSAHSLHVVCGDKADFPREWHHFCESNKCHGNSSLTNELNDQPACYLFGSEPKALRRLEARFLALKIKWRYSKIHYKYPEPWLCHPGSKYKCSQSDCFEKQYSCLSSENFI